jgi:hypothetical protein
LECFSLPGHGVATQAVSEFDEKHVLHAGPLEFPAGSQPRDATADDEDIDVGHSGGREVCRIEGAPQQVATLGRHCVDETRRHLACFTV